jgi:hypothetical protein
MIVCEVPIIFPKSKPLPSIEEINFIIFSEHSKYQSICWVIRHKDYIPSEEHIHKLQHHRISRVRDCIHKMEHEYLKKSLILDAKKLKITAL